MGATSSFGQKDNPFITTAEFLHKPFYMPTGDVEPATDKTLIYHDVRKPAIMIDMVTQIVEN